MIGKSQAFIEILNLIQKMGNSDVPVVIDGETGTGKELAARAIHAASTRRTGPFVALSCGSIPDAQFESELSVATNAELAGASEDDNMAECAQGGTLFLDEVETLLPQAQAALLRFLQDQQLHSMGGNGEGAQDTRIIVACNGSLSTLVSKGSFRQDLYYRLTPMHLKMPPLRDRRGDAALLANYFLKCCAVRYGTERRLDAATLEWIDLYRWPGNVRELENLISREYMIADKPVIHIQSPVMHGDERRMHTDRRLENTNENVAALNFSQAKRLAISEFERTYLDKILTTTEGNVTRAAKLVGKERRSLGKLLKKHGIDRHQYVDRADSGMSSRPHNVTLPAWIPTAGSPEAQPSALLQG